MGATPQAFSDLQVLAALSRAELHRVEVDGAPTRSIPFWSIIEQLAVRKRTNAARGVKASLDSLTQAGAVVFALRNGTRTWALTEAGRRQLRRSGVIELPESPQHRAWRDARARGEQQVEGVRESLRATLVEAVGKLDADAPSDVWFELSERLRRDSWLLASSTYCAREWVEPQEDQADVDDHSDPSDEGLSRQERARRRKRRRGRRNVLLWRDAES